jgi:hypothetical protein
MNATKIIARLIDSKAINGEEAICLLQSTKPMKEVFIPFNQVKEFGIHENPYSPVYPSPDAGGVVSTNITASSITLEEKEITIDGWVARDKDGVIYVYSVKPGKKRIKWISSDFINIERHSFPEVKWEDKEPTKVKLIIEKV